MSASTHPDQLQQLAELAGVGLFQVDADRNVVAVSQEVERITGFTRDEVLGRSCLSLVRCPECLRGCGVFDRGSVRDARLTLYRKDGSEVEVLKSGTAIRDEDGVVTGAIEALRLADDARGRDCAVVPAELDTMLRGLGRMFLAVDEDQRVLSASPALAELVGRMPGDLQGRLLDEIFEPGLFGPGGSLTTGLERGERQEGCLAALRRMDGASVPVSLTVGPLPPDDGCCRQDVAAIVMLRMEASDTPEEVEDHTFGGMLARSKAMQEVFRLVELLRGNDAAVLIGGESGTGKELVARAIHDTSHRAERPFVAVNCAAIPSELMESELFGHARGAFTGAVRDRAGRFDAADGGTLFLDEVGDLPLELQGKLLRVLQEREFERVGENRTRTVDVRLIAATNKDLSRAVAQGRFREDLYYRLRVIPVSVPPLRDRREDIPLLVQHFLTRIGGRHGRALRLSPGASRALLAYDWPGNVRELENAVEYAVTVCEGQTIHVGDLPRELHTAVSPEQSRGPHTGPDAWAGKRAPVPEGTSPSPGGRAFATAAVAGREAAAPSRNGALGPAATAEARAILDALEACRFRKAEAAELLGISRTTLWRRMREYGL